MNSAKVNEEEITPRGKNVVRSRDHKLENINIPDDVTIAGGVVVTMTSESSISTLPVPELSSKTAKSKAFDNLSISTTSSLGLSGWQPGQKFHEKYRSKWPNAVDATASCIGHAVGISNITRFPLLAFRNGGTAFFIPYLVFSATISFPILYLELILGQFVQQGCVSVWKIMPIFKGIGYGIELIAMLTMWFYATDLAWSLIILFESFNTTLSYTQCDNEWNSPNCIVPSFASYNTKGNHSVISAGTEYFRVGMINSHKSSPLHIDLVVATFIHSMYLSNCRGRILRLWPSKYSDGDAKEEVFIDDDGIINSNSTIFGFHTKLGSPIPDLTGCMFAMYCGYFLVVIYGIGLSRRITWVCVLSPYVVLPILLFRGVTLTGAQGGLLEFLKPNFEILMTPGPWTSAAIQCLFSTSAGGGAHLTISSHNYFKQDIYRDALWVCIIDTFVSLMASLVIFCYIGSAAYVQGVTVSEVVGNLTDGSDLTFEMLPDVLGQLSGGRFFLILFYVMFFLMGYNVTIPFIQMITTGFVDELKKWLPSNKNSEQILIFALNSWLFVCSLICCTRGGIWIYKFMAKYADGFSLVVCILITLITISWIWGLEDLCNAAEAMGHKPGLYLRLCWKVVSPVLMMAVSYLLFLDLETVKIQYNGETAPASVAFVGGTIIFIPFALIFVYAICQLFYFPASTWKLRILLLFHPENEHHDIKKGLLVTSRYTCAHIFYIGWDTLCKKKESTKPKIHPVDPVIVVTESRISKDELIRPGVPERVDSIENKEEIHNEINDESQQPQQSQSLDAIRVTEAKSIISNRLSVKPQKSTKTRRSTILGTTNEDPGPRSRTEDQPITKKNPKPPKP